MDTQKLEDAFLELVAEDPVTAMQVITGMFVSLTLMYMEARGYDSSGQIKIDSGGQRDITIHAKVPT